MYEWVVDVSLQQLYTYGFIVVIGACILEGMLVGKLLPYSLLVATAALPHTGNIVGILSIFALAVFASTIGQYTLYVLIQQYGRGNIVESRWLWVSESQLERGDRYFEKWGLLAVVVTNSIPLARGIMVIPAAISDTPKWQFIAASIIGTSVHHGAIVALAVVVGTHVF